jgi:hypothetical protein
VAVRAITQLLAAATRTAPPASAMACAGRRAAERIKQVCILFSGSCTQQQLPNSKPLRNCKQKTQSSPHMHTPVQGYQRLSVR